MDNNVIVKEKKGNNGYWIVIVILVFIIALLLGIILGQYIPNNKTNENTTTNEVTDKENSTNDDSTIESTDKNTIEKTDEDIVRELFIENYLESSNGEPKREELEEYRIEKIEIQTGEDRQDLVNIYSSDSVSIPEQDIFAYVTYSVKPKDIENTVWIAGNGSGIENGWILNKLACVHISYENGTYKIQSVGTGW